MNHLKVKDSDHLYRDVNSGAIINTDRSSFEKYKRSKLKFQNMEHELDHLKGEISEIKSLLKQLVNPDGITERPKTDSFDQQRIELNELALDVYNLKLQVDSFNLDDLVDVTAAGATNSQIIKYNGTEWVLDTDVVSTSFTVINANPSGSVSNLGYNNTNGTFTFTPADLSLYRLNTCLLYTSPSPRDRTRSRMPSSA